MNEWESDITVSLLQVNDLFTDYEEKGDKVVDLKGFEVFLKSRGRGRIGFH